MAGDETVIELATAITPEYVKLRRILKAWEADHPVEALHPEEVHDNVHDRFNQLGGYRLEAKARQILAGLGFRASDFERPAREMSGGWVMRAHLARLLVQEPDLLLLDEPTNHLDLEALLWLQDYLQNYPGAILVISHDREFLNQLVGSIVEIRQRRLHPLPRQLRRLPRPARGPRGTAARRLQEPAARNRPADGVRQPLPRQEHQGLPGPEPSSSRSSAWTRSRRPRATSARSISSFPQPQRSGLRAITLENIHHAYGENVVYRGMDFQAERGQRIVLVGPNGAGKSTLLKILGGRAHAARRARARSATTPRPATTRSIASRCCSPDRTVLEEAFDTPQRLTEQFVRTLARLFPLQRRRRVQEGRAC